MIVLETVRWASHRSSKLGRKVTRGFRRFSLDLFNGFRRGRSPGVDRLTGSDGLRGTLRRVGRQRFDRVRGLDGPLSALTAPDQQDEQDEGTRREGASHGHILAR